MARVKVVNRQVIDGNEYKRGATVEVSDGTARDLINAGKASPVTETPAVVKKEVAKNG